MKRRKFLETCIGVVGATLLVPLVKLGITDQLISREIQLWVKGKLIAQFVTAINESEPVVFTVPMEWSKFAGDWCNDLQIKANPPIDGAQGWYVFDDQIGLSRM